MVKAEFQQAGDTFATPIIDLEYIVDNKLLLPDFDTSKDDLSVFDISTTVLPIFSKWYIKRLKSSEMGVRQCRYLLALQLLLSNPEFCCNTDNTTIIIINF